MWLDACELANAQSKKDEAKPKVRNKRPSPPGKNRESLEQAIL